MGIAVLRIGYWSAIIAALACIGYTVPQLLQVMGLLHFPLDEILIFATSICIPLPWLLALLALHYATAPERHFFSHAGVIIAQLYAVYSSLIYITQLMVSLPLRMNNGNVDPNLFGMTQPALMFSVDSLAYILMSISSIFASFAVRASENLALRRALLIHGLIVPILIVVMLWPSLLMLGVIWCVTAPLAMFLLAGHFARHLRSAQGGARS